jgi:hypothetical protein
LAGRRTRLSDGDEQYHNPITNRSVIVSATVIAAAAHCKTFASISEHASRIAAIDPARTTTDWEALLSMALCKGVLMDLHDLSLHIKLASTQKPSKPLKTICIPTCNRPKLLARLIASLADNIEGRTDHVDVIIADDSSLATCRDENVSIIRAMKSDLLNITYLGPCERLNIAERTSRLTGIPLDVIFFGLLRNNGTGTSVGAVRNTLLLATAGRRVLFIDDDVVCRLTAIPHSRIDSVCSAHPALIQTRFLNNILEASHLPMAPESILELHETALNIDGTSLSDEAVARLDTPLLTRLCTPSSVIVAQTGVAGDCALDVPSRYFMGGADDINRITKTEAIYKAAMTNRAVLRGPTSILLSDRLLTASYCLAVDSSDQILPPFLPCYRGEEIVFGALISKCLHGALMAYIPRAILHLPLHSRHFKPGLMPSRAGRFVTSATLARLLAAESHNEATVNEAMTSLGKQLDDLSKMSDRSLRDAAHVAIEPLLNSSITRFSDIANVRGPAQHDAQQTLAQLLKSKDFWDHSVPYDLWQTYGVEEGRVQFRRVLAGLSTLLKAWPTLFNCVASLIKESCG